MVLSSSLLSSSDSEDSSLSPSLSSSESQTSSLASLRVPRAWRVPSSTPSSSNHASPASDQASLSSESSLPSSLYSFRVRYQQKNSIHSGIMNNTISSHNLFHPSSPSKSTGFRSLFP